MILPLPRKHQITRRSMLRSNKGFGTSVQTSPAGPARTGLFTSLRPWLLGLSLTALIGGAGFAEEPSPVAPLDRLKSRSADDRWEDMRRDHLSAEAEIWILESGVPRTT